MKKIGWVGCGKLGYPVACAIASSGYKVKGCDIRKKCMNHDRKDYLETGPEDKEHLSDWVERTPKTKENFTFAPLSEVAQADIVFIAVQTPHDPRYEGTIPVPQERVDFDYKYLIQAFKDLIVHIRKNTTVVIVSTVLPGTVRREIIPLCNEFIKLIYSPSFIAMGSTVKDFLNPEFVLVGVEENNRAFAKELELFYKPIHAAPIRIMSIESAELAKVAYNVYITMKISLTSMVGEICHKIPEADCDDVMAALRSATKRLISHRYMDVGMHDGGGCHPRDSLALSHLARKLDLHFDLFGEIMMEREKYAEWLGELLIYHSKHTKDGIERITPLPLAILGYAFKPETNITTGSHALLVGELLSLQGKKLKISDPIVEEEDEVLKFVGKKPRAYLIGCKHACFTDYKFKPGSVVIDPHRYLDPQRGVELVSIGSGSEGS